MSHVKIKPGKTKSSRQKSISFSPSELGVFETLLEVKNRVVQHEVFEKMGSGTLPMELFKKTLINFFPLVENFPKFMALNLAKTRCHLEGHDEAKSWLISNINVEQNHARWYMAWANGFGISNQEILNVR